MSLMRAYNNLPCYDGIDIIFYNDGHDVGVIRISREDRLCKGIGPKFEDVKCRLEEIIADVSREHRKREISDKIRLQKELQDFFANLSPEDMELMR